MQTSRHFVRTFVELASGMQYGHYDFQCGFLFFLVIIHRDTTSVVLHADGIVFVDGDFDVIAIAGECFVNGVVHHLVDQMVKSFVTNVANIHRGAFFSLLLSLPALGYCWRNIPRYWSEFVLQSFLMHIIYLKFQNYKKKMR